MKEYNLDHESYKRCQTATLDQMNTLLSSVYTEGYKKALEMQGAESIDELINRDDFVNILNKTSGIGQKRIDNALKHFDDYIAKK